MATKKTAFQKAKAFEGAKVKDTITGYVGVVTGVAIYHKAYDTFQCYVQSVDKNEVLNSIWIDHTRLEIIEPAEE